jgi:uncharacterized membrane protein YdjX (TVP38/TMEM64 family)
VWGFIKYKWKKGNNPKLSSIEETINFINSFGYISFFIYILFCIFASFLFVPLSVTRIIGIMIFGPLWGSILNIVGLTFGAFFSFFLSRYVFSRYFEEKINSNLKYSKINKAVEKHGNAVLIGTRLNPFFSNTFQNFLYGVTNISTRSYIGWTILLYGIGTIFMALWIELAIYTDLSAEKNYKNIIFILISIVLICIVLFILKKKSQVKR